MVGYKTKTPDSKFTDTNKECVEDEIRKYPTQNSSPSLKDQRLNLRDGKDRHSENVQDPRSKEDAR